MKAVIALYVLYILVIGALLGYIYKDVRRVHESFAGMPAASAECMKCMDYFHDVFQFSDTTKIVPYVQQRAQYLMFILGQFKGYLDNDLGQCPREGDAPTVKEVIKCFPAAVERIVATCVQNSPSRADCTIISRFGDRVLAKAQECGAKACSLEDFRQRFLAELKVLAQDLEECRARFENDGMECSKLYAQVMLSKTRPSDPLARSAMDAVTPASMTDEQLRKYIGETTAFMMTQFA